MKTSRESPEVVPLPVTFTIGTHAVVVRAQGGRWAVSVDGASSEMTFPTQAEAWEAGVREADRVDRLATR